jgi:hypothetical protein
MFSPDFYGHIVEISKTDKTCPGGERGGSSNREEGKIPVLSREGACVRREIARLTVNPVQFNAVSFYNNYWSWPFLRPRIIRVTSSPPNNPLVRMTFMIPANLGAYCHAFA